MTSEEASGLQFHPDAAARFNSLGQEFLGCVKAFGRADPPAIRPTGIHPVIEINEADIIGEINVKQSYVNLLGEEQARFWDSQGLRVGWDNQDFERIKQLARQLARTAPIADRVSEEFMLDEVFRWLRETLEAKRQDSLTDYIAERCSIEIKDCEVWIPVYRTYSALAFSIGDVEFLTVSAPMMEQWFSRILQNVEDKSLSLEVNRERSILQGSIAARVKVKAEPQKARASAHAAANKAIAMLRFLSPINWTCRVVSHCMPVGKENTVQTMELFVEASQIVSVVKASVEQGPAAWNIDQETERLPGLLESIQKLASAPHVTKFRGELYEALQLHSRHTVAIEVSHKIVFVVASIESLLLKDSIEPIQKNLGERMAFLIGSSVSKRKEIIKNVEEFYRIRSALIHHGRETDPKEFEVIDKFFLNVWLCFLQLLNDADKYQTREDLFATLEEKKLS
jgi:hypothetical protein